MARLAVNFLLLPAYNEANSLRSLLPRLIPLAEQIGLRVIVVNDGSTDATAEVARSFGEALNLECVDHQRNLGLGAALRTGFVTALAQAQPRDVVIAMAADDTHPPDSIPELLVGLEQGADCVIASRFTAGGTVKGVNLFRQILSQTAARVASPIVGARGVTDFTCGYRAYSQEILERAHAQYGDRLVEETGFACMLEVLIKLARIGARFAEVPLSLRYDLKQSPSKMRLLATISASLRVLWRAARMPASDEPTQANRGR